MCYQGLKQNREEHSRLSKVLAIFLHRVFKNVQYFESLAILSCDFSMYFQGLKQNTEEYSRLSKVLIRFLLSISKNVKDFESVVILSSEVEDRRIISYSRFWRGFFTLFPSRSKILSPWPFRVDSLMCYLGLKQCE